MHWFCALQQGASSKQLMLHLNGLHIGALGAGVMGVLLVPASRVVLPASLLVELTGAGVDVPEPELVEDVLGVGVLVPGVLDVVGVEEDVLGLEGTPASAALVIGAAGGMGTLQAGAPSSAASPVALGAGAAPASRPLKTLA